MIDMIITDPEPGEDTIVVDETDRSDWDRHQAAHLAFAMTRDADVRPATDWL